MIKNHEQQDGTKKFDCVVKLFNPLGMGTWYLSELDPKTNIAYGLCVLDEAEYGINSLSGVGFKGRDKSTAKKLENEFKKFYKLVDKFEREAEVDKF